MPSFPECQGHKGQSPEVRRVGCPGDKTREQQRPSEQLMRAAAVNSPGVLAVPPWVSPDASARPWLTLSSRET